jgi:hypothetical protein
MNQGALGWMVLGVGVLCLSALTLIFGVNLLPRRHRCREVGTIAP